MNEKDASPPSEQENLTEKISRLQREVKILKRQLSNVEKVPSGGVGVALLIPGIIALVFSILKESQILAFIGLSLTFWGALFFFIRPIRYVKASLLDSTATSTYLTIDRIMRDMKFEGKSYYIPPYPKDVYLPEHLKGLKEMTVFVSANTHSRIPSIEELAEGRFLLKNPNGVCLSPPGLGILEQIEARLGTDISKIDLETLTQTLPTILTSNLHLAKEVEMEVEENSIYVKIMGPVYRNLYWGEEMPRSLYSIGCPLVSAIACAIAKAKGKITTIQDYSVLPDDQTLEVRYGFVEA